jgi:AcrR family transcriptional regulator
VAREAGVSPGAPYHHFPDRASLLAVLSAQGHQLLARELAARAAADTPVHALTGLIRAYVDFAHRNPAYFWLMFRPELSESQKHPDAKAAEEASSASLDETVADCVRAGVIAAGQVELL